MNEIFVRIQGGIYDRDQPGYMPDPARSSRGSYLAPIKAGTVTPGSEKPYLAVIDHGSKRGRVVYHVPTDGTPGLAVPAHLPGVQNRMLVAGSHTGFRTIRDAKAFMAVIAGADVLPTNRPATSDEVGALRDVIATYLEGLA